MADLLVNVNVALIQLVDCRPPLRTLWLACSASCSLRAGTQSDYTWVSARWRRVGKRADWPPRCRLWSVRFSLRSSQHHSEERRVSKVRGSAFFVSLARFLFIIEVEFIDLFRQTTNNKLLSFILNSGLIDPDGKLVYGFASLESDCVYVITQRLWPECYVTYVKKVLSSGSGRVQNVAVCLGLGPPPCRVNWFLFPADMDHMDHSDHMSHMNHSNMDHSHHTMPPDHHTTSGHDHGGGGGGQDGNHGGHGGMVRGGAYQRYMLSACELGSCIMLVHSSHACTVQS